MILINFEIIMKILSESVPNEKVWWNTLQRSHKDEYYIINIIK